MTTEQRVSSGRASGWSAAWRWIAVAAFALAFLPASEARAEDLVRGREVFQLCAACHGEAGEGSERYGAPAIAGLPRWYVEAQLTKFKQGLRGFRAEDTTGLRMRPMARSLMKESDLKDVAAYVATFKPTRPPVTLKGDASRGQATYATCAACHGPDAKGNQAIGAPALAYQADWYIAAQILKFKQGLRGTHPQDVTGAQMRPMAMMLADQQAIADVVTYIRSLSR